MRVVRLCTGKYKAITYAYYQYLYVAYYDDFRWHNKIQVQIVSFLIELFLYSVKREKLT